MSRLKKLQPSHALPTVFPFSPVFQTFIVSFNANSAVVICTAHPLTYYPSILEPGGYLQWAEYDMTTQTTIKADPTLSSAGLDAIPAFVQGFKKEDARVGLQKYVFPYPSHHVSTRFPLSSFSVFPKLLSSTRKTPLPPLLLQNHSNITNHISIHPSHQTKHPRSWIPHLPHTFTAHNLTHITASRHPTSPAFLQHQLDIFLLTYEELASKTLDKIPVKNSNGGGRGHGDHLRQLIEAASQESRTGVGWGMDRLVVVGRKARAGDNDPLITEGIFEEGKKNGNVLGAAPSINADANTTPAPALVPISTPSPIINAPASAPAPAPAPGASAPYQQIQALKNRRRWGSLLRIWKRLRSS